MTSVEPTVFVVDDEVDVRESLEWLVKSVDLPAESFESAESFLKSVEADRPGCVLTDVRMPGMGGLAFQEALSARGFTLPVIVVTAYANVPMTVGAMKAGAVSLIEKPVKDQVLIGAIREALDRDARERQEWTGRAESKARLSTLTVREREVLDLVVEGLSTRLIATNLGISPKTVEVHRAHMMKKMEVRSVAQLVREAVLAIGSAYRS